MQIKLSGFPYAPKCFSETGRMCLVPVPSRCPWWRNCLLLWTIPHVALPRGCLPHSHLSPVSIAVPSLDPRLSYARQPLASRFSPVLFPSCSSSEKGKDPKVEDRGHKAGAEPKRSEPPVRKVTLIEVRESQPEVSGRDRRKDVRHPGQQWQVPESASGVHTGKGAVGITAKAISGLREAMEDRPSSVKSNCRQPEGKRPPE